MVKPKIRGNVNFEIKSQFMRELREDTFSGNKIRMPMIMLIESSTLNMSSSSDTDGLAAVIRPHLDKECPLNEEVKQVDEVKYGEFGLPSPFIRSNGAKFRVGVSVMPRNIFEYLRLANLRNINMLVEMADMTKKAPLGLSFPDYLLAKYEKYQTDSLIWDDTYAEWCNTSPAPGTLSQESNNLRPRDYTFGEWTLIKVRHTDISEPVKKALLKLWLIDCFSNKSRIIKDLLSRSFYDYKWVFDLEIDQLADEYELGIGKTGNMLDKIWEYYKDVHRNNTYWWHDHEFEEEERDEMGIEIEKYDPPKVQVETFKVKKY
ncbi:hypothetical protein Tco_1082587 [Tanacetum coccineum]|uniref:Uncharacterized protein n=1 Tax=Tanacetum coccineum TaxID=301880 RepID=A0ABQ5I2Z7_9ASTR